MLKNKCLLIKDREKKIVPEIWQNVWLEEPYTENNFFSICGLQNNLCHNSVNDFLKVKVKLVD